MNKIFNKHKKELDIIRVDHVKAVHMKDVVVVEYPLTIYLNDHEWITLLSSGEDQYYLSIGFLFSEGVIKSMADIQHCRLDEQDGKIFIDIENKTILFEKIKGKRTVTTGCGKGTVFYDVLDSLSAKPITKKFKINTASITEQTSIFQKKSLLFVETGGVHACAMIKDEQILFFHEDIGRHNALDKIIGQALAENHTADHGWLLVSGRISSEIVIKAAKFNIGMIVSRSAPTNLAIDIAQQLQITIIGFVRGNRFNIYTGEERVLFKSEE